MTRLMKTLVLTAVCGAVVLKAALSVAQPSLESLQAEIDELKAQMAALQSRTVAAKGGLPGCMSKAPGPGSVDDIVFEGCNVYVRNGQGRTDSSNSVGNLIIGYNEDDEGDANARSGSHYLVIGPEHTYSRYGGLVAGYSNTASGRYASVSGGRDNTARRLLFQRQRRQRMERTRPASRRVRAASEGRDCQRQRRRARNSHTVPMTMRPASAAGVAPCGSGQ